MKTLLIALLSQFLTREQNVILSLATGRAVGPDERAALRAAVLSSEQLALCDMLDAPERWQPEGKITPQEAAQWGELLRTPLMRKLDIAMINMVQDQAQRAIHAEPPLIMRQAGYAAGFRGGWQVLKSISTLITAKGDATEGTADTAAAALEHLNP